MIPRLRSVPTAAYDKTQDIIRVTFSDSSAKRVRRTHHFSLLIREEGGRFQSRPVGFEVEFARELSKRFGLSYTDKADLPELLEKLAQRESLISQEIHNLALPIVRRHKLEVALPRYCFFVV